MQSAQSSTTSLVALALLLLLESLLLALKPPCLSIVELFNWPWDGGGLHSYAPA
ncbi:hypothetical protein M758_7G129800 [Ceratodon purpureus]|uniref:Uncharacterized protein n=1 Tax=Ceratodon purpureus TaxID=3225 RepID=A0A8T0H6M1_CERPU|nr:hypothetical protein KC19_7G147200 [Ceratodon purpureus]KAG0611296.1 hypothetical protein M758_7G129800 [Ceratodon purpureus]